MALVKFIQNHTITLGAGVSSNTATLVDGTDTAYCVPFVSHHVTTAATDPDALEYYCIKATFPTSTTVQVETTSSAVRIIDVQVCVVEFESSEVNIYHDDTVLYTEANTTIDISSVHSSVVKANTFVVATGMPTLSPSKDNDGMHRTELVDGDTLWLGRRSANGEFDASYWIVEATGTPSFTVQHVNLTISSSTYSKTASSPGDFTEVSDLSKTLLIGSHNGYSGSANNDDNPYIALTSVSNLIALRKGNSGSTGNDVTAMIVEFTGSESVQRGILEQNAATASENVTISEVDTTIAMPYLCGHGSRNGAFPGTDHTTTPGGFVGADFDNIVADASTDLRLRHSTDGGDADNDIAWQVIEWDATGYTPPASSRRVMVIS